MNKMKMHSPNLTQENIARIRELFPGCVTEIKDESGGMKAENLSSSFSLPNSSLRYAIDFDLLRQELSGHIIEGPQERYHLNWPGKREALLTANAPIAKTLRPCREESVDFDTTKNLFIEGDNLEALKLLQETYLGKVKMIYIDPPYNTGNDFIYEDDFTTDKSEFDIASGVRDEQGNTIFIEERWKQNSVANGRFHSDWLSMLYPRLKLAKNLLHEYGVIFISLDAGELAGLRLMCDEIFGAENFIDQLVWQKKVSPSNDSRFFSNDHELIVVYARNKTAGVIQRQERSEKHNQYYKNPDNDPRGDWNSTAATCNKNNLERPNLYYSVTNPNTGEDIWPSKSAVWAFSRDRMAELIADNRIYWGADGTSKSPRVKNFLVEAKKVVPRNILNYQDYGNTQSATAEYKSIMDGIGFDYPKPTKLMQGLINFVSRDEQEFIVLDFFAGSGTTAQAVFQQSAADGLDRKFILVQLPEPIPSKSNALNQGFNSIADISKERIRRAGKKIKDELERRKDELGLFEDSGIHPSSFSFHNSLDIGFRVLKIDSSNMADVYYTPDAIEQGQLKLFTDNIKPDRKPEDLLFQVLLDWGVDLSLPIRKETIQGKAVFFVNEPPYDLVACFDTGVNEDLVKELARFEPLRVVFRDTGFVSDAVKINVEQIFKQMSPGTEVKAI